MPGFGDERRELVAHDLEPADGIVFGDGHGTALLVGRRTAALGQGRAHAEATAFHEYHRGTDVAVGERTLRGLGLVGRPGRLAAAASGRSRGAAALLLFSERHHTELGSALAFRLIGRRRTLELEARFVLDEKHDVDRRDRDRQHRREHEMAVLRGNTALDGVGEHRQHRDQQPEQDVVLAEHVAKAAPNRRKHASYAHNVHRFGLRLEFVR